MDKLVIIANPDEHPEGREIAEWMGEDFNAEAFDHDKVTRKLRARHRRRV